MSSVPTATAVRRSNTRIAFDDARVSLLEQQVRLYAAENERLRRGIDNAIPMIRAGHIGLAVDDLTLARKRGA